MPARNDDVVEPLRFATPPVRQVELTVYFDTDQPIRASTVGPLHSHWKANYPHVSESAPLPPNGAEGQLSVLSETSHWPLPYTRYTSASERRAVAFQQDRFEVSWEFDDEKGASYPGFDSLLETLRQEFGRFSEALRDDAISIEISGSQCHYVNGMKEMTAAELCVGILTGWQGSPDARAIASTYVGVRLHASPDEDRHDCSSLVAVDSQEDGSATLTFDVARRGPSEDELGGISRAHDELISTFLRYTTEPQRANWGRK